MCAWSKRGIERIIVGNVSTTSSAATLTAAIPSCRCTSTRRMAASHTCAKNNRNHAGGAETVAVLCAALETERRRPDAVLAIRALIARLAPKSFGSLDRKRAALWFTMLGALDEAFGLLHLTLEHFALSGMIGISWGWIWMPEMRPLRADARFSYVVERLRFADYWNVHGAPDDHELTDGLLIVG